MPQMTPSEARLVDPILSEIARGYRSVNAPIAEILFPRVSVGARGGRIIAFGPDDYRLANTQRAPGANTKRVQYGYASESFSLVDHSLEGLVPIELKQEAAAEPPSLDLAQITIRRVQATMDNEREKQAVDLALDPARYGAANKTELSGNALWSDPASNPADDIDEAREIIRKQIGVRPNVLVLSPQARKALSRHPKLLDHISITVDRVPATLEQLQRLLEVDRIVEGGTIYHDGKQFVDMWGKGALLAYTVPGSLAEMGSPNFGYTYQLEGYPVVEEPYYERNPKSWIYPVTDARQPVLTGPSAGFLFEKVVG